jgi:hypothetical protein
MIGATTPDDKLLLQAARAETCDAGLTWGSSSGKLEDARCVAYNVANLVEQTVSAALHCGWREVL